MTPKIVLFEDNDADVYLIRTALDQAGLRCILEVCRDGEAAIAFVDKIAAGREECPDVLLLDLNLPKYSGDEILARMHSNLVRPRTVLVLTSSECPADRERALALGANACFVKPVDLDEFMKLGAVVKDFVVRQTES